MVLMSIKPNLLLNFLNVSYVQMGHIIQLQGYEGMWLPENPLQKILFFS